MNTTLVSPQFFAAADEGLSSATCTVPWYHTSKPLLGIPDGRLVLLAPLLAYWAWSGFYAVLDVSDAEWLARRRIHARTTADARNLAPKAAVLRAVLAQQASQTAFAWWWIQEVPALPHAAHCLCVHIWAAGAEPVLAHIFGPAVARSWAPVLGYATYWWLGPIIQLMAAMFIMDGWQYFLHRAMHSSRFLYKHIHSVHHRLHAPYAFGALYNHPVEGLLLDIVGGALAEAGARLTPRQTALFFTFAMLKGVDDHCGYRIPWNPLQLLFANCADYHDIHHQPIGMKYNFSQPFFVHFDVLLGTRMTRLDIAARKQLRSVKSQKA